jgi:hypothetical protein
MAKGEADMRIDWSRWGFALVGAALTSLAILFFLRLPPTWRVGALPFLGVILPLGALAYTSRQGAWLRPIPHAARSLETPFTLHQQGGDRFEFADIVTRELQRHTPTSSALWWRELPDYRSFNPESVLHFYDPSLGTLVETVRRQATSSTLDEALWTTEVKGMETSPCLMIRYGSGRPVDWLDAIGVAITPELWAQARIQAMLSGKDRVWLLLSGDPRFLCEDQRASYWAVPIPLSLVDQGGYSAKYPFYRVVQPVNYLR